MSKTPSQLGDLPTPQQSPRNPFGRTRTSETPTDDPTTNDQEATSAARGVSAPSGTSKTGRSASTAAGRSKRMAGAKDVLTSLPEDLAKRMESVIAYTCPHTGINQQSVFIRTAITKLCAELEARFNDGHQWPEVKQKSI